MELRLVRYGHGKDATAGLLLIDGEFFCYTCEDERRAVKLAGETRIPAGRYEIQLRDEGGLTKKYGARFPELHKGMLHLRDVPGFQWIYLHIGNDDDDTEGCPLVGYLALSGFTVGQSVLAYVGLYKRVTGALDEGEQVYITVGDLDV